MEDQYEEAGMRKIPLTQGKYALVDNSDYEWLNRWKWCCNSTGYAVTTGKMINRKKGITFLMHRLVMWLKPGDKLQVDHKNHNKLDNRKCNIRTCTPSQNNQNQRRKDKGLSYCKQTKKWKVRIQHVGNSIWLGRYVSKTEAQKVYNKAAKKLFGEFACLIN